jgi:processing peptidase subunit alpha
VHNRKVPVTEMTDKIDQVTPEDIQRVAARLWGLESRSKATVVCMGHEDTGSWKEVFSKYGLSSV